MRFIGLDLTDPFSRNPRAVDIAIIDTSGTCWFTALPSYQGEDGDRWLSPVCAGAKAGDVLVVDGPLGLSAVGHTMRECERALGTPGKTPDVLPLPGSKPFAGYLRGSVLLAEELIKRGWVPRRDGVPPNEATVLEGYPGATWKRLAGTPLPPKTLQEGVRARATALVAAGLRFIEPPRNHDQADAALCAFLGWSLHRDPQSVMFVGETTYSAHGHLREGMIVQVAGAVVQRAAAGDSRRARIPGSVSSGASRLPSGVTADWIYFATPAKADRWETAEFALRDGILWRKAHNSVGALIANVGNVQVGDVILLAYGSGNGRYEAIGTFRVQAPDAPVPGAAALQRIADAEIGARLTAARYDPDPRLGVHTAFLVDVEWTPDPGARVSVDRPAGNNSLWRA